MMNETSNLNPTYWTKPMEPVFEQDTFSASIEDPCLKYEVKIHYEGLRPIAEDGYPSRTLHITKMVVTGIFPHESQVELLSEQVREQIEFSVGRRVEFEVTQIVFSNS